MKPYMSFAVALVSIVFTSVAPCWVVSPNIGRVDLPDKGTVSSPGKGTDGAGRINMTNTSFPNGTAPNTPDDSVKSQGDEVLKNHSIGKTVQIGRAHV